MKQFNPLSTIKIKIKKGSILILIVEVPSYALTLVLSALASLSLGGAKPADLPSIDNNSPCVPNQIELQRQQ